MHTHTHTHTELELGILTKDVWCLVSILKLKLVQKLFIGESGTSQYFIVSIIVVCLIIHTHFPHPFIYLENDNQNKNNKKRKSGKSHIISLLVLGFLSIDNMKSAAQPLLITYISCIEQLSGEILNNSKKHILLVTGLLPSP